MLSSLFDSFNITAASLITQARLKQINIENLSNASSLVKNFNGSYHTYVPKKAIVKFLPYQKNEKNIGSIYIDKIIDKEKPKNFINKLDYMSLKNYENLKTNHTNFLTETVKNLDISLQYKMSLEILKTIKSLILKTLSLYEI
ncbi:hypothetical protein [Buchnera aphidicola]|uniref:hypothetical protein n=1 Tax=Buchnera aphidicola TaxID=9 RepID=UPI0031B6E66D